MNTSARSRASPGPVAAPQPLTPDSSGDRAAICTESTNRRSESSLIKALLRCAKGYFNTQAIISRSSHFAVREGSSTACLLEQKQLGNPITLISSCLSCPTKNTSWNWGLTKKFLYLEDQKLLGLSPAGKRHPVIAEELSPMGWTKPCNSGPNDSFIFFFFLSWLNYVTISKLS